MATRKPTTHNYKDRSVSSHSPPQPTRLIPQQLEEKREKGHKCAEKKLFYIDCEEEDEKE